MTLVTVHAVVDVPADIGVTEIGRIVVSVATRALEHGVVTRVGVASGANSIRVAVVGREVRMVEGCARPSGRSVTGIARRWEASRLMVRIRGVVVIRLVTAHASGRQRGVVAVHVAHHASHGCRRVVTGQGEGRVVVVERCPRPVRSAMADIAGRRESGGRVRRRIGVVVVGLMARNTGRVRGGQAVVPVYMALGTRHREVEAGQRKASRRVIESAAAPVGG